MGSYCYDFSGMFLGAAGAVGVGYYTKFFDNIPPSFLKSVPPEVTKMAGKYPEVQNRLKGLNNILAGGPLPWRVCKRAALGSIVYCFLECRFQGYKMKRSAGDVGLAGAIAGGLFGARGGLPMAGCTAAGFSAFAIASHFTYH